MKAAEIMTQNVVTIDSSATVAAWDRLEARQAEVEHQQPQNM